MLSGYYSLLEACSGTEDCYPGTCDQTNGQCACSPGFTANDCSESEWIYS